MDLSELFRALERPSFDEVVKSISMGGLRTFQLYDSFKIHSHLSKLNRERLRKAIPRLWERLEKEDNELAHELAQAVLVSNLPLVVDVLDYLEIPHDGNGFFDKSASVQEHLTEGWQKRVFEHFQEKYPKALLLLYINHLDLEVGEPSAAYLGS
jgi:hypothetical protein